MLNQTKKIALFSLTLLSSMSFVVHGQPQNLRTIIAPKCLLQKTPITYKTLSTIDNLLLIEVKEADVPQLVAAKHADGSKAACGGFKDVTMSAKKYHFASASYAKSFLLHYSKKPSLTLAEKKYRIQYETQVEQLIKQINPQNMWSDLTTLSNFENRNASTSQGKKAAEWIKEQVETMAKNNNRTDVSVSYIKTGGYKQPSVVAKIGDSSASGIVIGAHMDTIVMEGSRGRQPGADDDGTGTVTALETLRVLLANGMHFKKPLYFIWYAAEEEGLIGSQYVVSEFVKKRTPVDAVIHFDMTGYPYKNDPSIWLVTDHVSSKLTAYLKELIDTYVKQTVKYTRCGYACSDHASWTDEGFSAAMPFESNVGDDNPYIHSKHDTMDKLSLAHMTDYAKLGVAFAVELGEPVA